jgi:hypothetical protein
MGVDILLNDINGEIIPVEVGIATIIFFNLCLFFYFVPSIS